MTNISEHLNMNGTVTFSFTPRWAGEKFKPSRDFVSDFKADLREVIERYEQEYLKLYRAEIERELESYNQ